MTIFHGMNRRRIVLGVAAALVVASGFVFIHAGEPPELADQNWPKDVQAVARVLIGQYGLPDMAGANALVWFNNGPWRKTVLYREGFTHPLIGKERDHLEQVVAYRVPGNKVEELKRFDRRLKVNAAADELSSRADAESMNFLALNLADDIIKGERTVQAARAFYRKAKTLENTGKSSPYLEGLLFAAKSVEPGTTAPGKERRKSSYPPDYFDVPAR